MPSSKDTAPVKIREIVDGKYRVERILGVGGMGVVVAARHIELGTRVALKFLLPALAGDEESVARFQREARAAVRLRSEHAARVQDVGRLENGTPYLVMEFLVGQDLAAVLEQNHPLPIADAVGYVMQACEAIAEAHSLGIIHRDLKPQNLFLTRKVSGAPLVKVLDFGLAKSVNPTEEEHALTSATSILGSPAYMSPEQLRVAKDLDARSDIWALGVCLFELLTAHMPFEAPTVAELCVRVLTYPPPRIRDLRPEVPAKLQAIVERCLEKERPARFASMGALAAALEPFAGETMRGAGERVHAIGVATSPGETPSQPPPACDPIAETQPVDPAIQTQTATTYDSRAWRQTRKYKVKVGVLTFSGVSVGALLAGMVLFPPWRGANEQTDPVVSAASASGAIEAVEQVATFDAAAVGARIDPPPVPPPTSTPDPSPPPSVASVRPPRVRPTGPISAPRPPVPVRSPSKSSKPDPAGYMFAPGDVKP